MRKKINISVTCTCLIVLMSCAPKYYTPSTQNIPLIEQAGELQLGTALDFNHVDLAAAYGLLDKVNIIGNVTLHSTSDASDIFNSSMKLYELGAGYHNRVSKDLLLEIYGLGTHGSTNVSKPNDLNSTLTARIIRASLQPSLTYLDRPLSVSLSTKLSHLNFYNINGDLIHLNERQDAYLNDKKRSLIIEPAITLRAGNKKLKGIFQLGRSINLSHADFRQYQIYATLGFRVNLDLKNKSIR